MRLLLCILLLPLLLANALAQEQTQQRKWFIEAEKWVNKPNSKTFKRLKKQLKDYPLLPYLDYKVYTRYPYLANGKKIEAFLSQHQGTPLDKPLRKKWLSTLVKQGKDKRFLAAYQDIGDVALRCHYLRLQHKQQGVSKPLLDQIESLWLVGKSQPKACDPLFKVWRDAKRQTAKAVWKRLTLAASGGQHTLIPYLKKQLPKQQRYLADLWLKMRRSPSQVSKLSLFPAQLIDKEAQIATYALSRLIWRDADLAIKSYNKLSKKLEFSQQQIRKINQQFALALASKQHPQANKWLQAANDLSANKNLYRWHLAHLLRLNDWQSSLTLIDSAPKPVAQDLTFQYWHARALGESGDPKAADAALSKLAEQRHYYGFMASGQLALPPQLQDTPLDFSTAQLAEMAARPAAQRAYELLKLKRYTQARREWLTMDKKLSQQERLIAAVLADSWGWHDQAIFGLARGGYLNDVTRRFPLAHVGQVKQKATKNKLDPAWAMAIIRRESSFMQDANSRAGAKGLMQLMPGTARYLAKKKVKTRRLFNPEYNLQLGTQYMRYLLDKMQDNSVLATASYNAGWRRVQHWLPEKGSMPMDIWVETIPYKETRNYVKAVMAYRQVYALQLQQTHNLFEDLANMQIKAGAIR